MRLTIRTHLAMRTLMYCAANPGRILRKHDIATACNASENHLAQVIHLMARKGYLRTIRGRSGGLMLGRAADQISLGEVFRSIEGTTPFTDCAPKAGPCPLAGACRLTCVLSQALDAFYAHLDRFSLADLVLGNTDLQALMTAA